MNDYFAESQSIITQAQYCSDVPPLYAGNPFVEALPILKTKEDIAHALSKEPLYDNTYRQMDEGHRLLSLSSLQQVFTPMSRDVDLYRCLVAEMLASYQGRITSDPHYFQKVTRWQEQIAPEILIDGPNGYAPSIKVVEGISGAGKSSVLSRIFDTLPRAIRHSEYRGRRFLTTQVPCIRINCPSDASPKTLASECFRQYDAILGTNYRRNYESGTGSKQLGHVARLTAIHGTALIAVDNLENLSKAKSGGAGLLLNFLYDLGEWTRCVIVVAGTYDIRPLINDTLRQARRTIKLGFERWDRMSQQQFNRYLEVLWKFQYTQDETPLTDQLKAAMYDCTQGIPELGWVLYRLTQERAITTRKTNNHERITPHLIQKVARDNFARIESALKSLGQGHLEKSVTIPDLPPEIYTAKPPKESPKTQFNRSTDTENTPAQKYPNSDSHERQKISNSPDAENANDSCSLIAITQNKPANQTNYEALLAAGVLIDGRLMEGQACD